MTVAATLAPLFGPHIAYLQKGYEAAMAAHGFDAIILCSGGAHLKNRFDDQTWPLSPTPAFAHWCPLVEADSFVVVRPSTKPLLVRTVTDDFWESPALPESDHFWSAFDLVEVKAGLAGDALPGGRVAVITRDQGSSPPGAVNPPALITSLDLLRTKKTAYEVECLAIANRRAAKGHRHVASMFQAGTPSELELHLAFLQASEQTDATAPYQGIVALGPHASVLHYVAYERGRVDTDTSFLIDAGAKVLGYGSDITRTYVRGTGPAAKRFEELLKHMEALQQQICRAIRPQMAFEDLHDEAHRMLANALRETGIGRGGAEELVSRGITRALLPHGLGHSLGITVHDAGMKPRPPRPENRFLRNTSVIEPGHVFTIEPGIYIIDGLLGPLQADDRRELVDWSAIADLRRFGGIRIEDNILVEAGGIRNLTREAFAT